MGIWLGLKAFLDFTYYFTFFPILGNYSSLGLLIKGIFLLNLKVFNPLIRLRKVFGFIPFDYYF